ncbi:RNA polymerase sigma factor [Aquimarina algicola]|uniref:Sigma-70 family RNA polymerase sigma factor n=1 Tax=Aquimarina algicola TaxID=2589995 RepID=A0A504JB77_9FLAO|nr:sigma-70 family RNA polymerase sigma factor [Aquimarina algicola]TPN85772.1 sigma-70 family RNA polymerase sigma factor [Aquimarina algicola]
MNKKNNNLRSVCEEKNFEGLYDNYSNSLYSFLYFKCGDKDRASDLVQEAYVKLWKNCKKIFFEKAKSYLYTVANNQFLTEQNHQKIVLHYKTKSDKNIINYESPEYLLEEKEYMAKLENAIAKLTNAQREVFLLNRIEKKKYREIAEMLQISTKAVEKRMHAALLSLKDELGRKV